MSSRTKMSALAYRIEAAINSAANTGIHPRKVFHGRPEDWALILKALRTPQPQRIARKA